jgi:RNA polymerase sigma factor (sigma-70 family)
VVGVAIPATFRARTCALRASLDFREPFRPISTTLNVSHDADIIRRSLQRPQDFTELYERHADAVYRYAARRIDRDVAEDILSETFLVAFDRRGAFDTATESALPWLFGIATVLAGKHRRQEARAWRGLLASDAAGSVTVDEIELLGARVDAEDAIKRLATAMRKMRPGDRDVLLLFAWQELSYEQIATALEIPVGTVRSRLNRARRSLRASLHRGVSPVEEVDHGRARPAAEAAQ